MEKSFNLMGYQILIPGGLDTYNNLRRRYYMSGRYMVTNFSKYNSLDKLIENLPDDIVEELTENIDYAVSSLVKSGIMTCNRDKFIEKYFEYFDYRKLTDPIYEVYSKVMDTQSQIEYQRKIERSGRSRWQGGGFGLSGAIKGAVKAGALNMGTGLIRGVGDNITNANDKAKIERLKEEIFENGIDILTLKKDIVDCFLGVFKGYLNEIENHIGRNFVKFSESEATAIFDNTKNYINDKDQILKYLVQSINLYPYKLEYYTYLNDLFGDNDEITKIAEYFGYGFDLDMYKFHKEHGILEYFY